MPTTFNTVIRLTAPSWCAKIQFDEDGYASRAHTRLFRLLGWTVESVEDFARKQGWKIEKKQIEINV